ncbi:MAG: hypothetical protein Q9171_005481 [Xanthocarpia ochracea]
MHLRELCSKLWWLTLPLSTLQHPSKLTSRDAEPIPDLGKPNAANELDRRLLDAVPLVLAAGGGAPLPATGPLPTEFLLSPVVTSYNGSGVLLNQSSNNPFTQRGKGRDPYPDPDDPYPDPYPPGPDPYPPVDPDNWSFDWAFPPFGPGRKLLEIRGNINLKTTDAQVFVTVLGYTVGDFKGNLDDGLRVDVNIAVAKGSLIIYIINGEPKDQVWLIADLHLPLRQHFYKKIHMFDIPHRPGPPTVSVA